jgi:RND family efflux transporter MFP subunit
MTRARRFALFALLTVAAAWLWAHEGHEALPTRGVETVRDREGRVAGVNLGPEALRALDVQVAEVAAASLDDRLAAPATVVAPWGRHAFVSTPLAGKVAALQVGPGQPVAAGQVVAEVESLELADLRRELIDARNEAELAEKNLADLKEGNRRGSVTEWEVREAAALHRQALDAREVARLRLLALGAPPAAVAALLEGRDAPLGALPVRAPTGGVVTHVDVGVGQVVEPGDHLLEVIDTSRLWVKIAVLEKDLHLVRPGLSVELRFPAAGESLAGRVAGVGRALDAPAARGAAWVELDNPDGRLLPGLAGWAALVLPAARRGLLVPEAALLSEGAERFVLIEEAPGQYRRQNVVVQARRGGQVQVGRAGRLFPGDRVVTAGGHELGGLFADNTLRLSPEAERGVGLEVEPVVRRPVAQTVTLAATVELPPDRRAVASARLGGVVRRLLVGRDQAVAAGEVLAEVFSPELLSLQLDLLRADAQERFLREKVGWLTSARKGVVPDRTVREAETALAAARDRGAALRRKLIEAGLNDDDLKALTEERRLVEALPVRAPLGGTVVGLRATLGQAVKAETPLFEIHDLAGLALRVPVPERHLAVVRAGQEGRARFDAAPGCVVRASLARDARALTGSGRTVPFWADLREPAPALLLPGMTARLTVVVGPRTTTLAVPAVAVLRDGADAFVFVRRGDGSFERRAVTLGRGDDLFTEVTAGLAEGEPVAVRGVAELQTAYAAVQ